MLAKLFIVGKEIFLVYSVDPIVNLYVEFEILDIAVKQSWSVI